MGVDCVIGSLKPMLQVQITPLQWGLGLCLSWRYQKIAVRFGPFAAALSGFKCKFQTRGGQWE